MSNPLTDITQPLERTDLSILKAIVEGTVNATGDDFFRALVANLADATRVAGAFIAEFAETNSRVRTLAIQFGATIAEQKRGIL